MCTSFKTNIRAVLQVSSMPLRTSQPVKKWRNAVSKETPTPQREPISVKHHLLLRQKLCIAKDIEKTEPLHIIGKTVNHHSHYGNKYAGSLQKSKIKVPFDSTIPCWIEIQRQWIHYTKGIIYLCCPVYWNTLHTDQLWNQLKYPSTWIKKLQHTSTMHHD